MMESVLGVLVISGSIAWRFAWPYKTFDVHLWQTLVYGGAAYLFIGLVRDLYIKLSGKAGCELRKAAEPTICLESVIGPLIIAVGLIALGIGVKHVFHAPLPFLGVALGALFIVSGLLKNIVLVFRYEKDHISLIPW